MLPLDNLHFGRAIPELLEYKCDNCYRIQSSTLGSAHARKLFLFYQNKFCALKDFSLKTSTFFEKIILLHISKIGDEVRIGSSGFMSARQIHLESGLYATQLPIGRR